MQPNLLAQGFIFPLLQYMYALLCSQKRVFTIFTSAIFAAVFFFHLSMHSMRICMFWHRDFLHTYKKKVADRRDLCMCSGREEKWPTFWIYVVCDNSFFSLPMSALKFSRSWLCLVRQGAKTVCACKPQEWERVEFLSVLAQVGRVWEFFDFTSALQSSLTSTDWRKEGRKGLGEEASADRTNSLSQMLPGGTYADSRYAWKI